MCSSPSRRGSVRLIAAMTAVAMLAGCAVQPRSPGQSGDVSSGAVPAALHISQKDHDPCSEANRRSEALGNAIVGAIAGAAIGALAGALLGKATKGDARHSAQIGALLGAGAGILVGYNAGLDSYRRQCELHRVAELNGSKVAFVSLSAGRETSGEIVVMPDQGHFYPNSDRLTETGHSFYSNLARQYTADVQVASYERTVRETGERRAKSSDFSSYTVPPEDRAKLEQRWRNYRIVITGHTDDQRDASEAQDLSERRAKSVADLFREVGVPESSLLYQGAGAAYPIADNRDPVAREKNNRVEAVVLYEEQTLRAYAEARAPKYEYFSEHVVAPAPVATPAKSTEQAKGATKKPAAAPPAKAKTPAAKSTTKAQPAAPPPQQVAVDPGLDLGGAPVESYSPRAVAKLGAIKPPPNSLMVDTFATLVGAGSAHAAPAAAIQSCIADDPIRHRPGQIKQLSDGSPLTTTRPPISATESYLLSTYRAVFSAPAGTHFVSVNHVTARRTGELVEDPQFELYLNYQNKTEEQRRLTKAPDYSTTPVAYSVLGEGGLLIRQFFPPGKGLVCMDILIPNNQAARRLSDTELIYTHTGVRKVVNLTMDR